MTLDFEIGQWYRFNTIEDKRRWLLQAIKYTEYGRYDDELLNKRLLKISPDGKQINYRTQDGGAIYDPYGRVLENASIKAITYIPGFAQCPVAQVITDDEQYNSCQGAQEGENKMEYIKNYFDTKINELKELKEIEIKRSLLESVPELKKVSKAALLLSSKGIYVDKGTIANLFDDALANSTKTKAIELDYNTKISLLKNTCEEALMLMSIATTYAEKVDILTKYGVVK